MPYLAHLSKHSKSLLAFASIALLTSSAYAACEQGAYISDRGGDYVVVHPADDADNGEIVVAMIEDERESRVTLVETVKRPAPTRTIASAAVLRIPP